MHNDRRIEVESRKEVDSVRSSIYPLFPFFFSRFFFRIYVLRKCMTALGSAKVPSIKRPFFVNIDTDGDVEYHKSYSYTSCRQQVLQQTVQHKTGAAHRQRLKQISKQVDSQ